MKFYIKKLATLSPLDYLLILVASLNRSGEIPYNWFSFISVCSAVITDDLLMLQGAVLGQRFNLKLASNDQ
jgi:hypothetical protein